MTGRPDLAGRSPAQARHAVTEPVACPDLPCPDCGRPRYLQPPEVGPDGTAHGTTSGIGCATIDCPTAGLPLPVWLAIDRAVAAGAADLCPAGRPRPRAHGLPVPWVTPVTRATGPLWRDLHTARLARAQLESLCQVCGLGCDRRFSLIVDPHGHCLTSAPLHEECARLALAVCPAPSRARARTVTATRAQIHTRGDIAVELAMTQTWRYKEPRSGAT
ncbi:hypothetical protein ACFOY4_41350 [Actinomadura syzygii]|uniref:Uncharacterized protein n=1 Tax=Actinomadura syzygii TaxID=1427538 RepID=A0A5D0TQN9_9ACTN|nr:hypothetical protein [Actinomadura syzygii]TYC07575.1 hypothetical protein FXF65_41955 [Actinomadura syzygii]